MSKSHSRTGLIDTKMLGEAVSASFRKLDPRVQLRNPVMFAVYLGSILTTVLWLNSLWNNDGRIVGVHLLRRRLAVVHGVVRQLRRGDCRRTWQGSGCLLAEESHVGDGAEDRRVEPAARRMPSPATDLAVGDIVLVKAGETIPADGEVIEGVASVDESAITGESAPVVRESGGDRSAVTGGTRVISDWLIVRVTTLPGQSFLDRMIAMVEGAKRQKTPNEIALAILLAALTLVFLLVVATLLPYSLFSVHVSGHGQPISLTVLVALFVCLAPTTIGALLSAIGIAGMNRLSQANVIAMSGRAVEAAGDVDVLLLDKTGTITLGNRQATRFIPADGVSEQELAEAAHLASLADETAEGRSIAVLAKKRFGLRGRDLEQIKPHFVPFSARTE